MRAPGRAGPQDSPAAGLPCCAAPWPPSPHRPPSCLPGLSSVLVSVLTAPVDGPPLPSRPGALEAPAPGLAGLHLGAQAGQCSPQACLVFTHACPGMSRGGGEPGRWALAQHRVRGGSGRVLESPCGLNEVEAGLGRDGRGGTVVAKPEGAVGRRWCGSGGKPAPVTVLLNVDLPFTVSARPEPGLGESPQQEQSPFEAGGREGCLRGPGPRAQV